MFSMYVVYTWMIHFLCIQNYCTVYACTKHNAGFRQLRSDGSTEMMLLTIISKFFVLLEAIILLVSFNVSVCVS